MYWSGLLSGRPIKHCQTFDCKMCFWFQTHSPFSPPTKSPLKLFQQSQNQVFDSRVDNFHFKVWWIICIQTNTAYTRFFGLSCLLYKHDSWMNLKFDLIRSKHIDIMLNSTFDGIENSCTNSNNNSPPNKHRVKNKLAWQKNKHAHNHRKQTNQPTKKTEKIWQLKTQKHWNRKKNALCVVRFDVLKQLFR